MSDKRRNNHNQETHQASNSLMDPSRNPSISGIPPLPVSKFSNLAINNNNNQQLPPSISYNSQSHSQVPPQTQPQSQQRFIQPRQQFSQSQSSLHSSGSSNQNSHSPSRLPQQQNNNSSEFLNPSKNSHQPHQTSNHHQHHHQQQQQQVHLKQSLPQQPQVIIPQHIQHIPQSNQRITSPVSDRPTPVVQNRHPQIPLQNQQHQPQPQQQQQQQQQQMRPQTQRKLSSNHPYAERSQQVVQPQLNQQQQQLQSHQPQIYAIDQQQRVHQQQPQMLSNQQQNRVQQSASAQQYMDQQRQQQMFQRQMHPQQQQQQHNHHQQQQQQLQQQQVMHGQRQVSAETPANRQMDMQFKQRAASEGRFALPNHPNRPYGQQIPSQPPHVTQSKVPLLPKLNINHSQDGDATFNHPTRQISQSSLQSSARSPTLHQSSSLIRNGGKPNSPLMSSPSDFSSDSNSSRSNSTKTGLSKYHMNTSKNVTMNGRVIPQKIETYHSNSSQSSSQPPSAGSTSSNDYDQDEFPTTMQQQVPKKSRSFTSLSRRAVSTSSLSSNQANSSNNINGYVNSNGVGINTLNHRVPSTSSMVSKTFVTSSSKRPNVYPAMLSRVARAFQEYIILGPKFKDGLEYRDSFTGSEAVDVISRIIKTSDRNLALLLGRSLDAQKFFHDVTYEHRLRDSAHEVYQFAEEVLDPYSLLDSTRNVGSNNMMERNGSVASESTFNFESSSPIVNTYATNLVHSNSISSNATLTNMQGALPGSPQPNSNQVIGVFTLLTDCYSPTCSRDHLCYSIACPRRLEQQARLNMKPQGGLTRSDSHLSLSGKEEQKAFWSLTVPKTVLDSMDKREIKRQECIFETIYSERDFVKDLEYLREFWIKPLSETKIIKESEREYFVNAVFSGVNEIWEINSRFAEALTKRQQEQSTVKSVADLFLEFIPKFEPFIKYGAGQVMGKYEFDRQKRHNAFFVRFIEDTNNRIESRRLDVSSYLSKPTSRPARYPLLLKSIRDHTDPNTKEYENLNTAIEMLQKMLTRINFETGKASDRLNLFLLKQKLIFRPGELVDLKLTAEHRKLLYQCVLKKRNYQDKDKQGEVHVYLFDHALLLVKIKIINKREIYRVYQRPIPLPLLFVTLSDESPSLKMIKKSASTSNLTGSSSTLLLNSSTQSMQSFSLASTAAKSPISFLYLGRNGYNLTLFATNAVQRILIEKLESQTKKLIEDNDVFTLTPLSSKFFDNSNKINCVVPFDGGRKLLYGTDAGIYTSDVKLSDTGRVVSKPVKIILKYNIIQVEILDEYQMVLALCDKKLMYWPIDVLQQQTPDAGKNAKLGKELMTHVSFFKIGVCSGRMLVCAAKSSANLIRIFDPIDPIQQKKTKRKFDHETKDVSFSSEPVSISFLKTKLCVGCSKGFEIVAVESGAMEQLLDPADTSLDFALGKEGLKPLQIDRINSDFLLSYSSFSFFINHNGWRARPKWIINWEGVPHSFALWYPYLLAFDSGFIEIRHVESGELLRTIIAENIRFLHSSSQEILYAYEDEQGYDVVASLDFWDKTKKNKTKSATIEAVN